MEKLTARNPVKSDIKVGVMDGKFNKGDPGAWADKLRNRYLKRLLHFCHSRNPVIIIFWEKTKNFYFFQNMDLYSLFGQDVSHGLGKVESVISCLVQAVHCVLY